MSAWSINGEKALGSASHSPAAPALHLRVTSSSLPVQVSAGCRFGCEDSDCDANVNVLLCSALFQHGSALAPDLLPARLNDGFVAGLPGRRWATAPVRVPPGGRPVPGLWGQRLLLQPQERCGPSAW